VEALEACQELAMETDVIVGLTHLEIAQDLALAAKLPQVPLIMGGHDHNHMKHQVGNTTVAKADANVKSAYVHTLYYDKQTRKSRVSSRLVKIDTSFADDPAVAQTVRKWSLILKNNIKEIFPKPYKVIYQAKTPLDGRESTNRLQQTNLGQVITQAMSKAAQQKVDCAFVNSGSIRIDDQLSGDITAVDIFRTLPYGGYLVEIDMKGDLLQKVLEEGRTKQGRGAYLQLHQARYSERQSIWTINGKPLNPEQDYHVITTDFLLLGLDLESLTVDAPGVIKITRPNETDKTDLRNDIRLVIIDYLEHEQG
ncbi:MAG: bifunctional metallophosphatase/5'-nucleotidase, partial [Bacteroidota bacterium]